MITSDATIQDYTPFNLDTWNLHFKTIELKNTHTQTHTGSFSLILGVKSENQVEEEPIKNSPSKQYSNISPYALNLMNIHGEQDVLTNQHAFRIKQHRWCRVMQLADPDLSQRARREVLRDPAVAP